MRTLLYGSIGALSVVLALAILIGESSEGGLTGWDVVVAIAGFTAMVGIAIVGVAALVYELRLRRREGETGA